MKRSAINWFLYFSFPVDQEVLAEKFMEGQSFEEALEADRLFYVDFKDLDGYIAKSSGKPMVAPLALFYARMDGTLIPLAIQLFQQAAEDNPVRKCFELLLKIIW